MFPNNVLAKFVDIIRIFFYTHYPYFVCHCTEYKVSGLQVRISKENKINPTTPQLITAKISRCAWKPGSKTHSSLCQSNSQLQNEAALMFCRILAIEHRKCAAGHAGAHPGLQGRILLNYTRIENAHKVRKKTFNFSLCIEVQQTFSFPFSLLSHDQIPESLCVKRAIFKRVQQFYHATEIGVVASAVSACVDQPQQTKQRQLIWIKWIIAEHNLKHAHSGRRLC